MLVIGCQSIALKFWFWFNPITALTTFSTIYQTLYYFVLGILRRSI